MVTFVVFAHRLETRKENTRRLQPIITQNERSIKQAKEESEQLIHGSSFGSLLGGSAYSHRIVTISSAEVG